MHSRALRPNHDDLLKFRSTDGDILDFRVRRKTILQDFPRRSLHRRRRTNCIETKMELESKSSPMHVMLTVSDSGTGIPKTTLAKIFEPYFTTKEAWKGERFGLGDVHEVLKRSEDGSIVESKLKRNQIQTSFSGSRDEESGGSTPSKESPRHGKR